MTALKLAESNKKRIGYFLFKKIKNEYLLTNDAGYFCYLKPSEFELMLSGTEEQLKEKYPLAADELLQKGFLNNLSNQDNLIQRYYHKNRFLEGRTSLHIIVITLRCDHKCIYCQSSSSGPEAKEFDMTIETARYVVDRIFESPSLNITIEFQGGEPLLNFETMKFIIEYAKKVNESKKKNLSITLVSNLSKISDEKIAFLLKNKVSICTSFDGPEFIHNKNRLFLDKKMGSYQKTIKGLECVRKATKNKCLENEVHALLTVTRNSLGHEKEILSEYIARGFSRIHLRPMNTFIFSKKGKKDSISGEAFLEFYKKALNYIIELNLTGTVFYETTAFLFLLKILSGEDPNFLDLRSPCGAGIGQLAYNYDGSVYTCDEGRMMGRVGDESFKLGHVKHDDYQKIMSHPTIKAMCIASCLENLPGCSQCVFKPYCGVCPLINYAESGNIFCHQVSSQRCLMNKGILEFLFEKMKDKEIKTIFENWVSKKN